MSSRVDRRRFLKYIGAGAVALGGAAAGYYLYNTGLERKTEVVIPTTIMTPSTTMAPTTTMNVNHAPLATFKYRPSYLNPTDQQTIQFTNTSHDPDKDPLTYAWYVDGKLTSTQKDYYSKLPTGEHVVQLNVSDGISQDSLRQGITVEPDQIYPTNPLHLKHKGITYFAGPVPPDWAGIPNPDHDEMDEQLDTIHNELGCNAIIISGGEDYEGKLIECCRIAIEKGFERIHIQPRYMGASSDETVEKIGRFATEVRNLREISESVVYSVGHEFGLETAIIRGDNWSERVKNFLKGEGRDKIRATLPKMFRDILAICRDNYGYKISYAAIADEAGLVPWEDPAFESVGVDAILQEGLGSTEDWILDLLWRLKQYHKPVDSMEAGCMSFTGAGRIAGTAPLYNPQLRPYDEDEQANWIKRYCNLLNRAKIDGYFYTQYNDPPGWEKGYGLYNPGYRPYPPNRKRKKGFYMYKSYQRVT